MTQDNSIPISWITAYTRKLIDVSDSTSVETLMLYRASIITDMVEAFIEEQKKKINKND